MNITLPDVAEVGEGYMTFKYIEMFSMIGLILILVGIGLVTLYVGGKIFLKLMKDGVL